MDTCGLTARTGDGPDLSFPMVPALLMHGPVLGLTPREPFLILLLRGVLAHTAALHYASHRHLRPRPRHLPPRPRRLPPRSRRAKPARRHAITPRMVIATTAAPEPSTRIAASAPTAPTAALGAGQLFRARRIVQSRPTACASPMATETMATASLARCRLKCR